MRSFLFPQSAALTLMLMVSAPGWAIDPATMANSGNATVAACASCHGIDGGGQVSFPRLAGMNAVYLLKQLQEFASGRRANTIMQPVAKALSRDDHIAMANYYAALPVPAALIRPTAPVTDAGDVGARLATRGKWSEGVPACIQCHGPGGVGVGDSFPSLAGQPAGYIAAQLKAWKDGTRKNDPLELMRHLSGRLSAGEIDAVSQWFARQPVVAARGPS